ncbi:MAG: Ig-like domain-containing protein [Bacteroidales bacterium]|nr:Ig-like domain-containing protein [Bacteroidales bacterium]
MRILRYIFIIILGLGFGQLTLSQYYLKLKNDPVSLENDSVILIVDDYRGEIWWESSSDLVNWVSLFEQSDSLALRIDSSAYYRASIYEGTCDPVISDTVYMIEKLTITDSSEFTVDSEGGVFLLPSGIKVKIPRGAVTEPKKVRVDFLDFDEANALAPTGNSARTTFLTGLSIATEQFDFHKSIKIKIPVGDIPVTSLPVLSEFNDENVRWLLSDEQMIVVPDNSFIEIILKESDLKGASLEAGQKFPFNSIRSFLLNLYGDIFLRENSCRRLGYNSVVNDIYAEGSIIGEDETCQIIRFQLEVEYFACKPVQREAYVGLHIVGACEPELTITPAGDLIVKKNDSQTVALNTRIFVQPLSQQVISASSIDNNILISKPPDITDDLGNTSFEFYAVDNSGFGEIFLTVDYLYYLTTVYAASASHSEYFELDTVRIKYETAIKVFTYDECTDGSLMDCSQFDNANCEAIRETLIARTEITPVNKTIVEGDKFQINVQAFNYKDEPLSTIPNTEWSSSDETVATVLGGLVTGIAEGSATITALLCESEMECQVVVENPCESSIVEINTSDINLKKGSSSRIPVEFMEAPNGYIYIPILEFSSRDPSVATVEDGIITGHEVGETKIDIKWCDTSVVVNVNVDFSDPPDPGNDGIISYTKLTSTEVTLAFTRATDDNTEQRNLQYRCYVSWYQDINTVEDALLNGYLLLDWYYDLQGASIDGLQDNATYYFNFIVRDEEGNMAAYQMIRIATGRKWLEIVPGYLVMGTGGSVQLECLLHDGSEVSPCTDPVWSVNLGYPSPSIISLNTENGFLTVNGPGVASVKVTSGDAQPDDVPIYIPYSGGFFKEKLGVDHNGYHECGCYDTVNIPYHWDWYVYDYRGSYDVSITLPYDLDKEVTIDVSGSEEWLGVIDSPVCINDEGTDNWSTSARVFTLEGGSMDGWELLKGTPFQAYFYTAFSSVRENFIIADFWVGGHYNPGSNTFTVSLWHYLPHPCVYKISEDDFILR